MKKEKFTSGPWGIWPMGEVVVISCTGNGFSHPSEGLHVCHLNLPMVGNENIKPMVMANAALIASAPELYEALTDMLSGWKYIRETHGDLYGVGWDRAQQKAETAISKARGESC